jgi:hypothetical protein
LLTLLAACGPERPSDVDSETTVVVDLSASPIDAAWQPADCAAQPSRTECVVEGAEALQVTARGTWHVARDGLRWQPVGESSRLVARRGPGPGELIAPIAIGARDDTVLTAYDIARAQLVTFTPAGVRAEHAVVPPLRIRWAVVRHGRLVAYLAPPGAAFDEPVESAIVAFDPVRSQWSDTLALFPDVATSLIGSEDLHRPRFPWESTVRWDVCADGTVLLGVSDRWAVARVRGRDTVQRVERAGSLTDPLDARTLDAFIQEWEEGPLRRSSIRAAMLERARHTPFEYLPQLEAVMCGNAGDIVVAEAMLPEDTVQTWVRVSSDERAHARWSLPPVLFPQEVGDALVGVRDDGSGERLVVAPLGRR